MGIALGALGSLGLGGVAKLASGIGGSLLGGLGANNKQESTSKSSGTRSGTSEQNINNLTEAVEDPAFSQFRQLLLPQMLKLIDQASQPVYTDGKIASTLADINKQFDTNDINPALAGRGLLHSGLNSALRENTNNQRKATASQFFTQLPFMEQQAQLSNLGNALGLAGNFAGRAPVGQRTTGTQTGTTNETFNQDSTTKTTGGQGFLGGFGDNLGGWVQSKQGQSVFGKLFGLGG